MGQREDRLAELGYPLERLAKPAATYRPLMRDGNLVYLSGALPFDGEAHIVSRGKVPTQVSVPAAQHAAALCVANHLRFLYAELGSLDSVVSVIRLCAYVNSDPDFVEQHVVANGASELLIDVLGDAGWHARSSVGVASLPLGASVEVDLIVRVG
ncbi:MAG TPA: RidA family protein [Polyangiaceae bacterium]|jgi:enamine deaminase RidA (YjgF/YER057c/UK114 family)